jgi:hypothetical protein
MKYKIHQRVKIVSGDINVGRIGEIKEIGAYKENPSHLVSLDGDALSFWYRADSLEPIPIGAYGEPGNPAKVGDQVEIKDTQWTRKIFEDWFIEKKGVISNVLYWPKVSYVVRIGNVGYSLPPDALNFFPDVLSQEKKGDDRWIVLIENEKGELFPLIHKTEEGDMAMATFSELDNAKEWAANNVIPRMGISSKAKYINVGTGNNPEVEK